MHTEICSTDLLPGASRPSPNLSFPVKLQQLMTFEGRAQPTPSLDLIWSGFYISFTLNTAQHSSQNGQKKDQREEKQGLPLTSGRSRRAICPSPYP